MLPHSCSRPPYLASILAGSVCPCQLDPPRPCPPHACTHYSGILWSASLPPGHAISYQTPNVARYPPFAPQGRIALPARPPCTHDVPLGLHGIAPQPTHSRMASSSHPPGFHAIAQQPTHSRMASCSCPSRSLARHGPPALPWLHGIACQPPTGTWHHRPAP